MYGISMPKAQTTSIYLHKRAPRRATAHLKGARPVTASPSPRRLVQPALASILLCAAIAESFLTRRLKGGVLLSLPYGFHSILRRF